MLKQTFLVFHKVPGTKSVEQASLEHGCLETLRNRKSSVIYSIGFSLYICCSLFLPCSVGVCSFGWVGWCVCVCVWILISVISSVVCCWHVGSSHAHACWRLCPARPQQTAAWLSPSCSGPASTSGRTPHAAHWHGPDPLRSLLRPARWAHGSPCQGALLCGPSAVFCFPEKNVSLTCLLICSFICCWAPWSSAASGDCAPTWGKTVL